MHNRYAIMKQILSLRNKASSFISQAYRNYRYRTQIKELIEKSKDYYSIIPSIQDKSNKMQIKIFFKRNQPSIFYLNYCAIRKLFLFNVKRNKISQLKYRFCFIVNGNEIIDSKYPFVLSKGEYVNVVNFKDIQDRELKAELNKEALCSKRDWGSAYCSDTTGSGSSSEEEKSNGTEREWVNRQNETLIQSKSKEKTETNTKPILKQLRSFKRFSSAKHVTFGKVNIC